MFPNNRIQFSPPNLPQLTRRYTVCDLHFHSSYSDGLSSIDKIVRRVRELGIGIAITDHNDIRGAIEIEQYRDVFSIPGIEVTSSEGSHLLIYFYDSRELILFYQQSVVPYMGHGVMSSLGLSLSQLINRARRHQCLVVFPHPYSAMYTGVYNAHFTKTQLQRLLESADGLEAINANNLKKWNLKSALLGFNLGKSMVGGSDGHALSHMGSVVTYAQCRKDRYEFLEAIRKNANKVVGKEISLLRKLASNTLKFRSNISNGRDLMEKNVRYSRKVVALRAQTLRSTIRRRLVAVK